MESPFDVAYTYGMPVFKFVISGREIKIEIKVNKSVSTTYIRRLLASETRTMIHPYGH